MNAGGFFWLAGCDGPHTTQQPAGGDVDDDTQPIGGDLDEEPVEVADDDSTVPPDADLDDDDASVAEDDDDDDDDTAIVRPETPAAPQTVAVGDAPCIFPASLSYDAASDLLYTTCGGAPNALFRSTPLAEGDIRWSEVGYADGYPSNHVRLSERYHLIAHASPDGFTILDAESGTATAAIAFADLPFVDELGFAPNNPNGAALVGGWIFLATSNIDTPDYTDASRTTYFDGTVVGCPYGDDGTVDANACLAFDTTAKNPTSMALLADGRIAVLDANTYDLTAGANAAIDLFTPPAMETTAIDLGTITAQIGPALALTEGGTILLGRQFPTNALMAVDPESGIVLDRELPEVANFISGIETSGSIAAIADFGVFGEGGRLLFLDLSPDGWEGMPIAELPGAAGPSTLVGDRLLMAVTANDGMSASIVELDMGMLE